MTWGFFKKIVVADRLAPLVAQTFDHPAGIYGFGVLFAIYIYAFQIYFDFSAYSDIAIGAAGMLGFRLSENFKRPYFAESVVEFWNRWHITLSQWLRDYIFYPLRRNLLRCNHNHANWANLVLPPLITMLVSGLWHGAGWTFIIWGALHGIFYVMAILGKGWGDRILAFLRLERLPWVGKLFKVFITFNLVSFAWIFFRSDSVKSAFGLIQNLFSLKSSFNSLNGSGFLALGLALLLLLVDLVQERIRLKVILDKMPTAARWALYYLLVMGVILLGNYTFASSQFIYGLF
jgi:alginate O-acetyltransferase complex protein AlgI